MCCNGRTCPKCRGTEKVRCAFPDCDGSHINHHTLPPYLNPKFYDYLNEMNRRDQMKERNA